jgi:nitrite reductase/ring-hydroxylating ferredoxin subunit
MHQPVRVHPGEVMCPLEELEDPGSKAFRVVFEDGHELDIFAVRKGAEVFAYVNVCPHQYLPLNWHTDIFLTLEKTQILCVMHAARFEIETGEMVYGPMTTDCRLRPVPVDIEDGAVRLAAEGVPRF